MNKLWEERAKYFAIAAHESIEQKRKFYGTPYFFHPLEVGDILADFNLPSEYVAAGYLHDTVEDTGVTLDVIESFFGSKIAGIVDTLTEDKRYSRKTRKMMVLDIFEKADMATRVVKLADVYSNLKSIRDDTLKVHIVDTKEKEKFLSWLKIYLDEKRTFLELMSDKLPSGGYDVVTNYIPTAYNMLMDEIRGVIVRLERKFFVK